MTKDKKRIVFIIGLSGLALLLFILFLCINLRADKKEVNNGVKYLKSLESKDIDEISQKVQKVQSEERRKAIESGEMSVWELFASYNYVVMGDSRAVGFSTYDFLEDSRVLAGGGDTIAKIPENMDTLVSMKPEVLFLCYGLNDMSVAHYDTPENWLAAWDEIIPQIQQNLPDTQIIISSILPANEAACAEWSGFEKAGPFNEALKAYCEEHKYIYVDNDQTVAEHADLYNADGIHMQRDFYPYWATNLLAEVKD